MTNPAPNENYWEKIPIWNSDNPEKSFEITSDVISGRIPVTRIEHWHQYSELLESRFFNRTQTQYIFRGHRRYDWAMTPSLGRLGVNGIVTQKLADRQLRLFRKAIRGRIDDHSLLDDEDLKEADELWSIGQHHGLMTPLLDWTYSPYVALFFAFAKQDQKDEKDNPYRAIYILNKSFIENGDPEGDIRIFEPRKDDHGRLVSQAGLFTFSPYDATIENKLTDILFGEDFPDENLKQATESDQPSILAKYICKVYVKNEDQQACLRHLRRMNVHHASLFPDLIGAADYCNTFIAELTENSDSMQTQNLHETAGSTQNGMQDSASSPTPFPSATEPSPLDAREQPTENIHPVAKLLQTHPDSRGMDKERLRILVEEISRVLVEGKLVDWQERDALQAEMKTKTRVLLRKYGYPEGARSFILEHILSIPEA